MLAHTWQPKSNNPPKVNQCWLSRTAWLQTVTYLLGTERGEQARAKIGIGRKRLLAVAADDAAHADGRTGHNVITSRASVARRVGCTPRHVGRARQWLTTVGLMRTDWMGRHINTAERAEMQAQTGRNASRLASCRRLITPRQLCPVNKNVHPPRRGAVKQVFALRKSNQTRKRSRKHSSKTQKQTLAVQRLAAKLAQRLPWLARGHIGHLCRALRTLGVDDQTWTAGTFIAALDQANTTKGWTQPSIDDRRNPIGFFVHQARRAGIPNMPGPLVTAAAERAERAERDRLRTEQWATLTARQGDHAAGAALCRAALRKTLDNTRSIV